jgi:hypothetical protein
MPNVNIVEAKKAVSDFLMQALKASDVRVIGLKRVPDGWEAEAEVYEESAFIKALGLPAKVQDRNLYVVKEDDQLEVQWFERKDVFEGGVKA